MSETAKTLTCPNCGAALAPAPGASSMTCGYCETTVVIPQEFRAAPQGAAVGIPGMTIDFGQLMTRAIQMSAVVRLARAGNRDAAVRLFVENNGGSTEQAEEVIDALTEGRSPAPGAGVPSGLPAPRPRPSGNSGCLLTWIIIIAAVLGYLYYSGNLTGVIHNLISR